MSDHMQVHYTRPSTDANGLSYEGDQRGVVHKVLMNNSPSSIFQPLLLLERQCRKQIRAHTPNACKFLGGRVIFKSHQPNWACKRHRKWKMVHLAFVLDGQRSDIHREPIVARRDSIAPCGYASRATASTAGRPEVKPLLIEERNHTPRR